jgi:Mg-chelatase subunit ChlD
MKRTLISMLAVVILVSAASGALAKQIKAKPRVEVVFVLDTTGSMSGMIESAKAKIWAIANTMASAKPTPAIRMGLVAYRDRGDAYVTQRMDLTDDLDAVYTKLMALKASGGGDSPESVNQALHEAVTAMTWSKGKSIYRVIYLVGDCPPHMDYANDVKYPVSCKAAATAGININTIQCGNQAATTPIWRSIAALADGDFMAVDQSGGAVVIATPYDKKIAEAGAKMEATRRYYGSREVLAKSSIRMDSADRLRAKAKGAVRAQRAEFNASAAGKANFLGSQELVDEVASGKVKIENIKNKELPKEMRAMTLPQRKAHLSKLKTDRAALEKQVLSLSKLRDAYIRKEMKKTGGKGEKSFNRKVYDSMKKQAAEASISFEGGPKE